MADAWEILLYNNLATLTSANIDEIDFDGLTNLEEFRGFKWGPALAQVAGSLSGTYQTTAYVPNGTASHFWTHPSKKDLFVRVQDYDFYTDFNTGTFSHVA